MSDREKEWPILGHNNIVKFLRSAIKNDKLAHAYLLVGPKKVGKSVLANFFVRAIFCQSDDKNIIPCNQCNNCRQFSSKINPDFKEVTRQAGSKNITIDQIRELIQFLILKSFLLGFKVALIKEVQYLETEAANALLKTLEEPPGRTIIILTATALDNLPATLVSRCQVIKLRPLSKEVIFDYLNDLNKFKSVRNKELSYGAEGLPGLMFEWVDNIKLFEDYKKEVFSRLEIFHKPLHESINMVKETLGRQKFFNQKIDVIRKELSIWRDIVRDLLLVKLGLMDNIKNYFAFTEIKKLSSYYSYPQLITLATDLLVYSESLSNNPNPELTLENFYIKINKVNIC